MLLLLLAELHELGWHASTAKLDPHTGPKAFVVSSVLWRIHLENSYSAEEFLHTYLH